MSQSEQDHEQEQPPLFFTNCQAFTEQYLLPAWRHTMAGSRWCADWWKHAEAVIILDALWRSFEGHLYGDPSGMATWWRDFADPLMGQLTRDSGTFAQCDWQTGEHALNPIWATTPPPAGMFGDENQLRAVGEQEVIG